MNREVKPKPGRPGVLTIFVNNEPWRDIHSAIFGRQPRLPVCTEEGEWERIFQAFEYQRVKNYVLWRISSQSYHSQQLSKLLKERLIDAATIEKVIQECLDQGFLNDQSWIESFIRVHRKRLALPAILRKLQAKGITREILQTIQEECQDVAADKTAIDHLLQTRYRSKDLKQIKDRQKVIGALLRKGFSYELIQQRIKNLA